MKLNEDKAITGSRSGLNCSQEIVSAFSEELNFQKHLALGFATGFVSGLGRLQFTCGAVSGSFMVPGILNNKLYSENQERKT